MTNVYVRQKPLLENDKKIVSVISDKQLNIEKNYITYDGQQKKKFLKYNFDGIFNSSSSNDYIFDKIIKNNLNDDFTCFMYGQTGSGKTYTVLGTIGNEGLFIKIGNHLISSHECLFLSAYQIYNEELKDLLNSNKTIKMYETDNKNFEIPELTYKKITNINELETTLKDIKKFRTDGINNINFNSSRSHAVLMFTIKINKKILCIRIIDLAGNERSKNSKILNFESRQENKYINSSLFALKECIRSIDSKNKHIPFRRSKLTSVLRNCFTKNHNSIMIATICSNLNNYSDIVNTLTYASKVNNFKPIPKEEIFIPSNKYPKLPSIQKKKKEKISYKKENFIISDEEVRIESVYSSESEQSAFKINNMTPILLEYKNFIKAKIKNYKSINKNIDLYLENYPSKSSSKYLSEINKDSLTSIDQTLQELRIMERIKRRSLFN
ncbi:Kinesin motor domain [seawater metagenome]|uniref:Kinesin motor domain n=1 Tax=seawater metagenome TaxID=1561972 RepID=A0A5E8CM85_9ZZZZ